MATVVRTDTKTGRLVRSVVPLPAPAAPVSDPSANLTHDDLDRMIDAIAGEQGVEAPLVRSVVRAESNYDANALSPKGAQGIMQLIPATARRFGVANAFDPRENIRGGVRYLRFLLDYYQGDYAKAVAAYNAGEAAVDKFHGIPPYAETQNYVYRVARNLTAARAAGAGEAAPAPAAGTSETGIAETSRPIQTSTGSDGRIYYRTP